MARNGNRPGEGAAHSVGESPENATEHSTASNIATIAARSSPPIRAELSGRRRCSAVGITANGNAPVLALCRRLIEAGHDPAARLEAYRGTTLCLRVRSIGEGARLTVREGTSDGRPRFVKLTGDPADMKGRRNVEVGPPIAPNDLAATPLAEPLQKTPSAGGATWEEEAKAAKPKKAKPTRVSP